MVRAFDQFRKSSSFKLRKVFEITSRSQSSSGSSNLNVEAEGIEEKRSSRSRSGSPVSMESQKRGSPLSTGNDVHGSTMAVMSRLIKEGAGKQKPSKPSDMDLMKEKFAKLLLGEDMSGGGKGVSSALALSNAITNLAASVFGEQRKLEPMKAESRARWRKEVDWLLSVTDHIVEFVASQQQLPNGTTMEVMATRQRGDLLVNIPGLRKLDTMLMDCLDNFRGQNEFWYVDSKDLDEAEKKNQQRDWWIPVVKVPTNGLSEITRKWIQHQKDSVNQVLKAALSINAQVLSEMEIPESYIESLPKNGRASLGDSIYKNITDDYFDPEQFLGSMDLTSELKVLDLKNRIEASIVIWKRKMVQKDAKSSWSSAVSVSMEKRELFEDRAETILLILKHHFPGIPQSSLDISKIQYNKDVGHAVLESYSRVLESLASAVMCRIDDVLHADTVAHNVSTESNKKMSLERVNSEALPGSMTLLDFMGWSVEQGEDVKKVDVGDKNEDGDVDSNSKNKIPPQETKKISYLERLENWGGMRSPTARH
ncbi:hypothetical protein V2J09_004176 [Rumex salicifolius]